MPLRGDRWALWYLEHRLVFSDMMMVFESLDRVADDGDPSDPEFSDMTDFPSFDYTTSDVRNAGKIIASDMLWADETEVAIRQAYAVANSWRDSHVIPMRSIRLRACC